jgi:hypothetical protein
MRCPSSPVYFDTFGKFPYRAVDLCNHVLEAHHLDLEFMTNSTKAPISELTPSICSNGIKERAVSLTRDII